MTNTQVNTTKVVTGLVRFSYLHVFEPRASEGSDDKKYSVSLIIPKSDKKTLAAIHAAIEAAKVEGKEKLSKGGKLVANIKTPLRDGDTDRPEDEAYANSFFINCSSRQKPGIVDRNLQPILDPEELYSGCYGVASIKFFAYDSNGNKGIAAGLNHLMKVKDGPALGGAGKAEEEFKGIDVNALAGEEDDIF